MTATLARPLVDHERLQEAIGVLRAVNFFRAAGNDPDALRGWNEELDEFDARHGYDRHINRRGRNG